jgi:hypothetical protein
MNVIKPHPELIPTKLISLLPKHEEMQYLELIKEILSQGALKDDRTGTGVASVFGRSMRFDLS